MNALKQAFGRELPQITPAGLLDEHSAEESIRKETAEETGYLVHEVHNVFEAFMSPGSVTERLCFFVAEYDHRQGRALAAL